MLAKPLFLLTGFTPNLTPPLSHKGRGRYAPLSPALARGVRAQIHRLRQSLFNHLLTRAYVNAGLRGFIP